MEKEGKNIAIFWKQTFLLSWRKRKSIFGHASLIELLGFGRIWDIDSSSVPYIRRYRALSFSKGKV